MTTRLRAAIGGLALLAALAMPSAATAADSDYVGGNGAKVKGTDVARPQADPADDDRGLPITGADVAGLAAIGAASVGAGAVLVRRSRRRSA